MTKTSNLEDTAYHEAGHAVAHYFLQIPFRHVTIEPRGNSLGHVEPFPIPKSFKFDIFDDSRTRIRIEKEIMIYYAGHAAESIFTGRKNWKGASSDNHSATSLALSCCGSLQQSKAFLGWMWLRTVDWIRQPLPWNATKTLAQELLKNNRLKVKDAKRIIRETLPSLQS